MTKYVYLGGPITGLTFDAAKGWRETFIERADWPEDWAALSPMRDKEQYRRPGALPSTFDGDRDPFLQDIADIDQADAVIFNFLGATWASIGSCAELGYAYSKGKPICVVLEKDSVHDHLFVNNMATVTVSNLSYAIRWLRNLYSVEAYAHELARAA